MAESTSKQSGASSKTSQKRAYDLTDEESKKRVDEQVKEHFKPRETAKKVHIDPNVLQFFQSMCPENKKKFLSDYDRQLTKASNESGKQPPKKQLYQKQTARKKTAARTKKDVQQLGNQRQHNL